MSASRTRRQMIQRMGRILRRKRPGVAARFVIMFAKDTLEDPTNRIERDGFLDEIERISEATGVFDSAQFEALDAFLAAPGPEVVPEPEHLEQLRARRRGRGRRARRRARRRVVDALADEIGVEVAYAFLSFARRRSRRPAARRRDPPARRAASRGPSPTRAVSRGRARRAAADRQAEGRAEAPVDRAGAARDRAHRIGVADQLHRMRRSITARPVPVAGARPDRAPAAASEVPGERRDPRTPTRIRAPRWV